MQRVHPIIVALLTQQSPCSNVKVYHSTKSSKSSIQGTTRAFTSAGCAPGMPVAFQTMEKVAGCSIKRTLSIWSVIIDFSYSRCIMDSLWKVRWSLQEHGRKNSLWWWRKCHWIVPMQDVQKSYCNTVARCWEHHLCCPLARNTVALSSITAQVLLQW